VSSRSHWSRDFDDIAQVRRPAQEGIVVVLVVKVLKIGNDDNWQMPLAAAAQRNLFETLPERVLYRALSHLDCLRWSNSCTAARRIECNEKGRV